MNKRNSLDTLQRPDFYVAILLFVIAFAIRHYFCPSYALSTDESFTANISCNSPYEQIFGLIWNEGSPPLLYLLLKLWTLVFSSSDQSIKLFAIALSSLIPPAAYLLTISILGSRRIAISTCLLCLLSPVLIRFGNLIRPYALTCIFSLLSTYFFILLFSEKKPGKVLCFLYIAATVLNAYSHLWGIIFSLAQAVVVAVQWARKSWKKEQIKRWAICSLISGILFLPWAFVLITQIGKSLHPWYHKLQWYEFLAVAPMNLLTYTVGPKSAFVPFYISMVFSILIFYGSIFCHFAGKDSRKFKLLSFICFIEFALAFLLAMIDIPYRERYLLCLTVFVYALLSNLFDRFFFWIKSDLIFAVIPVCVFSIFWFSQWKTMHLVPEACVGNLISNLRVSTELKPTDTILVAFNSFVPEVLRKSSSNNIIATPFIKPFKVLDWQNQFEALADQNKIDAIKARAKENLLEQKPVWYIGLSLKQVSEQTREPYFKQQLKTQEKIKTFMMQNARIQGKVHYLNSLDGPAEAIKFIAK